MLRSIMSVEDDDHEKAWGPELSGDLRQLTGAALIPAK